MHYPGQVLCIDIKTVHVTSMHNLYFSLLSYLKKKGTKLRVIMLTLCFCLLLVPHQVTSGLSEFQQEMTALCKTLIICNLHENKNVFALFNWPITKFMPVSKALLRWANELLFTQPAVKDHDGKPVKLHGLALKKPTNP